MRVGLTGGIGSGKSLAASVFEALGVPVYYADLRARELMDHDPSIKRGLTELFGPKALGPGGAPDRGAIASAVFGHPERLAALNALVHPAVGRDFLRWASAKTEEGAPYVVEEAAILVESGAARAMDAIVDITAPEELRIARVLERNPAIGRDEIVKRIAAQLGDPERKAAIEALGIPRFEIANNTTPETLEAQVRLLHAQLTERLISESMIITDE